MSSTIVMENTRSRIVGVEDWVLRDLIDKVVFFDSGAYHMASKWVRRNRAESFRVKMVSEDGFFPTGILHRIQAHLKSLGKGEANVVDYRVVPKTNVIKLSTRCFEPTAYVDQDRCREALVNSGQGIAQVPTGVGKTRIIKDVIQEMGVRTLVITPSSALKEQTSQYLEDCFGSENVGIYDKRFDKKPVTVMNYHAVGNTDEREWKDFDLVLFDEFHHGSNNTIRDFNSSHLNHFYFRHGLTATNFTSSDESAILLESVLSKTVFSMSILDAIKKGYIVPIVPVFFKLSNANLVSQDDYRKDYSTFIDDNQERNQIILETMEKMESQGIPSLTLVKHIKHGKALSKDRVVFLNGQDANSIESSEKIKSFNRKEIPSMIGTSVIGEGVDTKACGAIFNAKGGKSKRELLQNIGRAVRTFEGKSVGYYFDFIDTGQKHLAAHSRKRIKIIEQEFGMRVKVIET